MCIPPKYAYINAKEICQCSIEERVKVLKVECLMRANDVAEDHDKIFAKLLLTLKMRFDKRYQMVVPSLLAPFKLH